MGSVVVYCYHISQKFCLIWSLIKLAVRKHILEKHYQELKFGVTEVWKYTKLYLSISYFIDQHWLCGKFHQTFISQPASCADLLWYHLYNSKA